MHLTLIESLMATLLICLSPGDGTSKRIVACLPADVQLEEVVAAPQLNSTASTAKRVTVKDKLSRLKARCRRGKLVTGVGREIRFYRLIGCWGNPPADYQEQLEQQNVELRRLKRKYTVVEIPCALDPRTVQ